MPPEPSRPRSAIFHPVGIGWVSWLGSSAFFLPRPNMRPGSYYAARAARALSAASAGEAGELWKARRVEAHLDEVAPEQVAVREPGGRRAVFVHHQRAQAQRRDERLARLRQLTLLEPRPVLRREQRVRGEAGCSGAQLVEAADQRPRHGRVTPLDHE